METIHIKSNVLNFSGGLFNLWSPRKYDVGCIKGDWIYMRSLMVVIDIMDDGYKVIYPRIKNIDGKIILGQDKYVFDCEYLSHYEHSWDAHMDYTDNCTNEKLITKYDDTFEENNYFTIHKITFAGLNKYEWFYWVRLDELETTNLRAPETKFHKHLGG
jgi:hypothetical protein